MYGIDCNDETVRFIYHQKTEAVVSVESFMSEYDVPDNSLLLNPNDYGILLLPIIHKKDLLDQYLSTLMCDKTKQFFTEEYEDFLSLWLAFMESFDGTMIADGWFDFLFETVKTLATQWCEENHIQYEDDFQIL